MNINDIYESGEDYLETIYLLSLTEDDVHSIDIAKKLGFSKPSITRAMATLKQKGYIVTDEKKHITLTEAGRIKAMAVYERHKTISALLIKYGVSEEIAQADACRIEHDISEETFKAFVKMLNTK